MGLKVPKNKLFAKEMQSLSPWIIYLMSYNQLESNAISLTIEFNKRWLPECSFKKDKKKPLCYILCNDSEWRVAIPLRVRQGNVNLSLISVYLLNWKGKLLLGWKTRSIRMTQVLLISLFHKTHLIGMYVSCYDVFDTAAHFSTMNTKHLRTDELLVTPVPRFISCSFN